MSKVYNPYNRYGKPKPKPVTVPKTKYYDDEGNVSYVYDRKRHER